MSMGELMEKGVMSVSRALDAELYEFTQDVEGALFEAMTVMRAHLPTETLATPPLLQIKGGYAESPGWFLVQAREFDPEPLTIKGLRVRDIYASERIVRALLDIMAGERWLHRRGEEYTLAEEGRAIYERSQQRQQRFISELAPLPAEDITRLESMLGQVIKGCKGAPTPPGNWCVTYSRRRAPGEGAQPLERIRQYLDDLNAFRDDAHMAAWMPLGIEGYEWETFSHVRNDSATTNGAIFDALIHRGYSLGEYEAALSSLAGRGWLEQNEAGAEYQLTKEGSTVWQAVEELTDWYFYAPWRALPQGDANTLITLLEQMRDNLRSFAASAAEE